MPDRTDIALAEYKQVADQFRALTEIRFKLLALLPLGTGAAAFFVEKQKALPLTPAIAAFAFVVTLCIAMYNKRNDQYYDELVARAAELERGVGIEHGSFSDRPKFWLKYGFIEVDHRWAIGGIYAAAAGLWAYLFAFALVHEPESAKYYLICKWPWLQNKWPSLQSEWTWLQIVVPVLVILCWWGLRWIERKRGEVLIQAIQNLMDGLLPSDKKNLEDEPDSEDEHWIMNALPKAIKDLMDWPWMKALPKTLNGLMYWLLQLSEVDSQGKIDSDVKLIKAVTSARRILGVKKEKAKRRVKWHWEEFEQKRNLAPPNGLSVAERDRRAASALLAAIIDMPARWIEDVWSGRR